MRKRLSSKQREDLYDAEAAKAKRLGRGELPICNLCDLPVNGTTQAWDESHQKHKPHWLGGIVDGISHRRCNRLHNNTHDTPLYAKSNRQRQLSIGAKATPMRPMIGTLASGIKKPMKPYASPIDRRTGQPWRPGQ